MEIHVKVKTNAKVPGVFLDKENGTYTVSVKAIPIEGMANDEVVKQLAKKFDIPKSLVTIKTGQKSNIKTVILNK